ncbi:MAG: hypothetical protein ABI472_22320 [Ginsengibacter sp.]
MKDQLKKLILLGWLFPVSMASYAQGNTMQPLPVQTENEYWVIESNIHTPKVNIVYIYNNHDSLIYKEKIEDTRINTKRKAIIRKLNRAVEKSLWAASAKDKDKHLLVKAILKNGG